MIGKIVYLDPADVAAGARDRIEWANADRVALVMPPKDQTSYKWREFDFAFLKRAGQQLGTEMAIVSTSLRQRQTARAVGLVAFGSVEQAIEKSWLPSEDMQPVARLTPPRRFQPNSLRRLFRRKNWFSIILRAAIALMTVAVLAAAVVLSLPTAQITLTASSQEISTIVPVTLSTRVNQVDTEARVVPAQRVDVIVEGLLSTPATGKKSIPRSPARGTVTFSNILTTPYVVPRNTVVRTTATSTPARFVTLKDIEVPPGGRADAPIEALEDGPQSNVGVNQINRVEGMPSLAVTVLNTAPTGGGANVTVPAVTEDDYNRLRAELRAKLLDEAAQKMLKDRDVVNNGMYVLPDTLFVADVQDETFDRFITEQADKVNLNMRLQVAGLAINPRDLDTIARDALSKRVPEGFTLLAARAQSGDVAEEGTGTQTVFYVNALGQAGAEIDENAVKRLARGKTIADAQAALLQTFSLKRNPQIKVEPEWLTQYLNRLPYITLRIDTEVRRE